MSIAARHPWLVSEDAGQMLIGVLLRRWWVVLCRCRFVDRLGRVDLVVGGEVTTHVRRFECRTYKDGKKFATANLFCLGSDRPSANIYPN